MENNQFDNEIKKMLEGLEVPFQDTHWDSMAQRLQETQELNTPDKVTEFDKSISEKITGFDVPYSESSWIALRRRLVASAYLKKWILQTKSIEGLFVLIFALFWMNDFDEKSKTPVYHGPVAHITNTQQERKSTSGIDNNTLMNAKKHSESSTASNKMDIIDNQLDNDRMTGDVVNQLNSTKPAILTAAVITFQPVEERKVNNTLNAKILDPFFATTGDIAFLNNPFVMLEVPSQFGLAIPKIDLNQPSKVNFGISVYGIINADYIITGEDPTTKINVPNVWSPGYGGGIAFSKRKGKMTISAGVEYQEVKYFPKPIIRITQGSADLGYAGAGTTTVELTKVSVPVSAAYTLVNNKKHQLSAGFGLLPAVGKETFEQSTFIVSNSNTENENLLRQKMNDVGGQPTVYVTPNVAPRYTEPEKVSSRLSKRPKFFASARANISYEYKLDRYHSIFAKASYSHQLTQNGIGLPKDQLSTVGLHFGSRVYL